MRKLTLAVAAIAVAVVVAVWLAAPSAQPISAQDMGSPKPAEPDKTAAPTQAAPALPPDSQVLFPSVVPDETWKEFLAAVERSQQCQNARALSEETVRGDEASARLWERLYTESFLKTMLKTGMEIHMPEAMASLVFDEYYSPDGSHTASAFTLKLSPTNGQKDQTWIVLAPSLAPLQFSYVRAVEVDGYLNAKCSCSKFDDVDKVIRRLLGGYDFAAMPSEIDLAVCGGTYQYMSNVAGSQIVATHQGVSKTNTFVDFTDMPLRDAISAAAQAAGFDATFSPAGAGCRQTVTFDDVISIYNKREYLNVVEGCSPPINSRVDALNHLLTKARSLARDQRVTICVGPRQPLVAPAITTTTTTPAAKPPEPAPAGR